MLIFVKMRHLHMFSMYICDVTKQPIYWFELESLFC